MTQGYPEGASPTGAAFGGEPWTPPGSGLSIAQPSSRRTPLVYWQESAQDPSAFARSVIFEAPTTVGWWVRRILVYASVPSTVKVYITNDPDGRTLQHLVSFTESGALDENDTLNPYWVPAGSSLVVEWDLGGLGGVTVVTGARVEVFED